MQVAGKLVVVGVIELMELINVDFHGKMAVKSVQCPSRSALIIEDIGT